MSSNKHKSLVEMERYILGALLTDVHVTELVDDIQSEMFLDPDHAKIYLIIQDLDEEGVGVTYVTVSGRVGELANKQDAISYLSACMHLKMKSKDLDLSDCVYEIRNSFAGRRLMEIGETVKKMLGKGDAPIKVTNVIENEIEELSELQRKGNTKDLSHYVNESFKDIVSAKENGAPEEIPWAFNGLHSAADGSLQYTNFHAIMLDSAGGKTSLALQQMYHTASLGKPVLYISYEQDEKQCIMQLAAQRLGIESKRMRSGDISEAELKRIMDEFDRIMRLPIDIVKAGGWGAKQIVTRMRKFQRRFGRGLAIIDHAKSISLGKESMFSEQIGQMMITIRDGLKDTGHAGMMLAQRRTESWDRDNPEPVKSDIYGRDGMHEPLDLLLAIWRPEQVFKSKIPHASTSKRQGEFSQKERYEMEVIKYSGKARILSLKNRYGNENARSELVWDAPYTRFKDVSNTIELEGRETLF